MSENQLLPFTRRGCTRQREQCIAQRRVRGSATLCLCGKALQAMSHICMMASNGATSVAAIGVQFAHVHGSAHGEQAVLVRPAHHDRHNVYLQAANLV